MACRAGRYNRRYRPARNPVEGAAMAKAKPVVVTVTDEAVKNIEAVADKLAAEGMKVEQVLPVTGVITGSCPAGKKGALRSVKGVHSVEDDVQVQLPPPGADVQ